MADNKITDWEEITDWTPAEDAGPSKLGSFSLGALQGVSFGFADEIEAAGRAFAAGELNEEGYKTRLQDIRARYKEYEEANPMSSLAGNIASGFLLPGGLAKGAASIGKMAAIGAGTGAALGAGMSEADLVGGDVRGLAKDAVTGLAAGALTGAAVPILSKVGSGVINIASEQPIIKHDIEIFKDAIKGITHSGTGQIDEAAKAVAKTAEQTLTRTNALATRLSRKLNKTSEIITKRMQEEGLDPINIQPLFDTIEVYQGKLLSKFGSEDVDMINEIVSAVSGKGTLQQHMDKLNRTIAKDMEKKTFELLKVKDKISALEQKVVEGDASDAVIAKLNELKRKSYDLEDTLSSLKPFQMNVEPATGVPTVFRDTDIKRFVDASQDITQFDPGKSAVEVRNIVRDLNRPETFEKLQTGEGKELRSSLVKKLDELVKGSATTKEAAAMDQARTGISNLSKSMEKEGLRTFYPVGDEAKFGSDARKLQDLMRGSVREGAASKVRLDNLIEDIKDVSPKVGKKIEEDITKTSRDLALASEFHMQKAFPEADFGIIMPSARATSAKVSEIAGSAMRPAEKIMSGLNNFVKPMMTAIDRGDSKVLKAVADRIKATTGLSAEAYDLAKHLDTIITMSPAKQKATIFALTQQPQYRKTFEEISNSFIPEE